MVLLGNSILAESSALERTLIDLLVLVGSIAPLFGMVRCLASSRKPDGNAKATWALAAVFAAVAVPGLAFLIGQPLGALVGGSLAAGLLYLNAGILILGLLLTALILSTIAWTRGGRGTDNQPVAGRRLAIGAFVSSLTLAVIVLAAREFVPTALRHEPADDRAQALVAAQPWLPEPPVTGQSNGRVAFGPAEAPVVAKPDTTPAETKRPSQSQTNAALSHDHTTAIPAKDPLRPVPTSGEVLNRMLTAEDPFDPNSPPRRPSIGPVERRVAKPTADYPLPTEKQAAGKDNGGGSLWNVAQALLGLDSKRAGSTAKQPTIETLKNERLNFQFRPPDVRWVAADPKRFNRDACAAYMRAAPNVFFMIIAERLGVESGLKTDSLLEFNRARALSAAQDMREIEKHSQALHGMPGMRVVQEATLSGMDFHYEDWVCVQNGFSYQLMAYGRAGDRDSIAQQADKLFAGFEVIDPLLVCHADRFAAVKDFTIEEDGFRLKLGDRGWQAWSQLATAFPSAEFGALRGDTGLAVVPIHYDDFRPARDARLAAFLAVFGCADAESALEKREAVRIDKLPAVVCSFDRSAALGGGEMHYCVAVAQTDDFDYGFGVWSGRSSQEAASTLHDVLSRVVFFPGGKRTGHPTLSASQNQRYAKFFNFLGMHYFRARQATDSEPCFLQALRYVPDMTVALENYVSACLENSRFQPALDAMQEHDKAWKSSVKTKLMHAWLLSKTNRSPDSIREFEDLFRGEVRNDDYFCAYLQLLEEAGRRDDALTAMDKYLARGDSLSVALTKARCLSQQGKMEQALDLLQARRRRAPHNIDVQFALVDALERAERFTEAHELVKEMLADGREPGEVLLRKGILEMQLKWYKDAKATLEDALRRSPGDERVQTYLNRVSGILGEGANVQLKQPVAEVELPAELRAAEPKPLPANLLADAQAYYRRHITAIAFEPEKAYRTSTYLSIEVLTDTGAARFSTVQFDFDPLNERIFVNRLEVFDDQGKSIAKGDVADYFVADEAQDDVATHRKTLHVPIAGVRPKSRIEICVTKEDIVPPREMPYVKHLFTAGSPIATGAVSVTADPNRLTWSASKSLATRTSERGLCWQIESLPPLRIEPDADEFEAQVPFVRIVDKQCTWKTETDAYRKEIKSLMPVSDEVRRLAADLTGKLPDGPAKIAAVVDYLQKQFTYKAIEFGHRARIMNSPDKTLHNRYGDCKDHSLVLCQLLQALGLKADLALVGFGGDASDATPSLDQFNHMIVCLHDDKGDRFIDATDKESDPNLRVPYGLAGKHALLLDWDHPRLVEIPEYPAGSNTIDVQRTIQIDREGNVQAGDRITYSGYFSSSMRHYFKAIDPTRRKTAWQASLGAEQDVQVQDLSVEALEERRRPVVVSLKYKVPHALHVVDRRCVGRLPAPWETVLLSADRTDNRNGPMWLQLPLEVRTTISVEPPSGFDFPAADSFAAANKSDFFDCRRSGAVESHGLRLHCEVSRRAGHFPASSYSDYVDQAEQARLVFTPNLVLSQRDK